MSVGAFRPPGLDTCLPSVKPRLGTWQVAHDVPFLPVSQVSSKNSRRPSSQRRRVNFRAVGLYAVGSGRPRGTLILTASPPVATARGAPGSPGRPIMAARHTAGSFQKAGKRAHSVGLVAWATNSI